MNAYGETAPHILKYISLMLVLLLGALPAACCTTSPPQNDNYSPQVSREVAKYWASIKAIGPPRNGIAEKATWLAGSMNKSSIPFWEMCTAPDLDERLRCYVDKFGHEGPEADLAWILAEPTLLLTELSATTPSYPSWPDDERRGEFREGIRHIERLICKAEVTRFLRNPNAFQRYYRALMWSCYFLRSEGFQEAAFGEAILTLRHGFPSASDEDYWGFARCFILMAHATGRDDLLENASADDLRPRFFVWREWIASAAGTAKVYEHLKPDNQNLVWHFDPNWTSNRSFEPVTLPDRPFDDMVTDLPTKVGFREVVLGRTYMDAVAIDLMDECVIPLGRERIRRKVPTAQE